MQNMVLFLMIYPIEFRMNDIIIFKIINLINYLGLIVLKKAYKKKCQFYSNF